MKNQPLSLDLPPSSFSSRMRFDVSKDGQMQNLSLPPSAHLLSPSVRPPGHRYPDHSDPPPPFPSPSPLPFLTAETTWGSRSGSRRFGLEKAEEQAGRESEIDRLKPFFPRT